MLSNLVGTFDFPSMLVIVAFAAATSVLGSTLLMRKRHADYEIEAKKSEFEHQEKMASIESSRDVGMAKMQQNLITSHSRDSED